MGRLSAEDSGDGNTVLDRLLQEEKEVELSKRNLPDEGLIEAGKANDSHEEISESKSNPENMFAIEVDNDEDEDNDDDDADNMIDAQTLSNPELHTQKNTSGAFSEWESKEGLEVGILGDSGVAHDVHFGVVQTVGKDGVTIKYDEPPEGPGGTELIHDPTRAITDPKELKRLRSWRNPEGEQDRHEGSI